MAVYDEWPLELLWPGRMLWRLETSSRDAGGTEGGQSRYQVNGGGGRWRCEMSVPLLNDDAILTADALIDGSDGGFQRFVVPVLPRTGFYAPGVPHDDGTYFDDGTGYVQGDSDIKLAEAIELRETALTVNKIAGPTYLIGRLFSMDDAVMGRRLYRVRKDVGASIDIRPPARADYPINAVLDFDKPGCVMRLINADVARDPISPPYISALNLIFREALDVA